jgi:hypothetical protein
MTTKAGAARSTLDGLDREIQKPYEEAALAA